MPGARQACSCSGQAGDGAAAARGAPPAAPQAACGRTAQHSPQLGSAGITTAINAAHSCRRRRRSASCSQTCRQISREPISREGISASAAMMAQLARQAGRQQGTTHGTTLLRSRPLVDSSGCGLKASWGLKAGAGASRRSRAAGHACGERMLGSQRATPQAMLMMGASWRHSQLRRPCGAPEPVCRVRSRDCRHGRPSATASWLNASEAMQAGAINSSRLCGVVVVWLAAAGRAGSAVERWGAFGVISVLFRIDPRLSSSSWLAQRVARQREPARVSTGRASAR